MSKATDYVAQSLASAGFALVDGEFARTLRPDLWHDGIQAAGDIGEAIRHNALMGLHGVLWGVATFEGSGRPVPVVTRSTDALATRIQWITGRKVLRLEQAEAPAARPKAAQPGAVTQDAAWVEAQRIERLRKLAAQEPPEHGCALRTEILRAREELARLNLAAA